MAAPARFRSYVLNQARQKFSTESYGDALDHYLLAIKLNHDLASEIADEFVLCLRHWTDLLQSQRYGDRLMATFESASSVCNFSNTLLCALGEQALRLGEAATAGHVMQKALQSFPQSICVQETWERVSYAAVERWHFKMLNDRLRNKAYCDAITRIIQEKNISSVLDIGCGTGLLSLFADRAGADRVIMCDDSSVMTSICSAVIDTNQQQSQSPSQFEIIDDRSTNLSVPSSCLPKKVDLVVTEIFDAALFGEHCLSTLCHAWSELLNQSDEKTGHVLPRSAQLFVCAIECLEIRKENCVHSWNVPLPNMNVMNIVSKTGMTEDEPYTTEDLYSIRNSYRFLSPVQPLMMVDFNDPEAMGRLASHADKFMLDIYAAGTADALAVWFDLELCEGVRVSTAPSESCCWEQAIFPVLSDQVESEEGGLKVNSGDQLEVILDLNEGCLRLALDKVIPLGYFLNTCHISNSSEGAGDTFCPTASNTKTEQNYDLQAVSKNPTFLLQEESRKSYVKKCKFNKITTKDVLGKRDVGSMGNEWLPGYNVFNEEGKQESNERQHQHATLSAQFQTECFDESKTDKLLLCHQSSEHVTQQFEAGIQADSTGTKDKIQTVVNQSDSLKPGTHRNTTCVLSTDTETLKNNKVFCEFETLNNDKELRTVVERNSISLADDNDCRKGGLSKLSISREEPNRSQKALSDECDSCVRNKKDATDPSTSDIEISSFGLSDTTYNQKFQTLPANKIMDSSHLGYKFHLHREEIRHFNDYKYNSLCCSALQLSRTCLKSQGRMVNVSSGFPLCGLLALKSGFAIADLCYVGPSEKREVEDLIDRVWHCSGLKERQWNWWEGLLGEVVQCLGGGVQLDLAWMDAVEMTGSLRSGLMDELIALRPVLSQDVIMVPQAVDVYAVLIESPQLLNMSCVTSDNNTLGFNIAPHINLYKTRTFLDLDIHSLPHENVSEVAHVFHLDIQSCMTFTSSSTPTPSDNCKLPTAADVSKDCEKRLNSAFSQSKRLQLTALKSGKATAMVFWFDLTLAPGVNVSTVDPEMNWRQAAFMMDGVMLEEGQEVVVETCLEKSYLHFAFG